MAYVQTEQPRFLGLRHDHSGSIQYLGGFDGPLDEADVKVGERSQPGTQIPVGLEVLEKLDRFVIQQVVNPEASWWSTVDFVVEDGRGHNLFDVKEIKSMSGCGMAIFGKGRPYYMKVIDVEKNNWIMEFEHPRSCMSPALCPWAVPSMVIRMPTGEVLGQVKHSARETCGSCIPPSTYFELLNYKGEVVYTVQGPTCCPCECTSNNVTSFQLMKEVAGSKSGPQYVGEVSHVWRGCQGGCWSCCITDETDRISISFPRESSVEDKALFLGLAFLVAATYFEVQ